jgi:hypothetical protein
MAGPLRKTKQDGTLYQRRPEIESRLDALTNLSRSEVANRCKISDPTNTDHIPSECLLHLVRRCRSDNSDRHFEVLFRILRQRVIARLPAPEIGHGADGEVIVSHRNAKINESVMDRFQELLVSDRSGYDERLDYFEVNFDAAVAALRLDGRRKALKEEKRSEPMTYDDETSDLNAEIEEAAAAQNPISESKFDDPAYRSRIYAAIESLPENQRRVLELLRLGIPIDSKEPGIQTIVQILGCVEKTVRNRRDRAFEAIRKALKEEET